MQHISLIQKRNQKIYFALYLISFILQLNNLSGKDISDKISESDPVISQLALFRDSSRILTIEDVVSGNYEFKPQRFYEITTDNALWYRFRINFNQNIKSSLLLQIDFPPLEKIELFSKNLNGNYLKKHMGTSFPISEWEMKERMPVFYIPKMTDEQGFYYLRVESKTPILLNMKVWEESRFKDWNKQAHLILGGFYGILFMMFLFNLFLYFSTKDLSCLIFLLFLASYGFFYFIINGFAFQYLWPDNGYLNTLHIPIFLGFYYIFGAFFTQSFLRARNVSFAVNKLLNIGILIGLLLVITPFLFPIIRVQEIGFHFLAVFILLQLAAGIIAAASGFRPARMYIAGLSPLVLFLQVQFLTITGNIPSYVFGVYELQIASFLQMCFLSFALGNRVKLLQIERRLEIEKIRRSIFRDLHDDIGNNLASVYMMSQRYLSNGHNPANSKERLQEITDIIFNTADSLREIIWFNNPDNYLIDNFILHLKSTAAKTLKDINFNFEVGKISSLEKQPVKIQKNLYLMFKEILGNILKHACAANVFIEIKETEHYLNFSIRDDGVGFNSSEYYEGMGLKNLKLRASEINSSLEIISEPEMGTEILIKIRLPEDTDGLDMFSKLFYAFKGSIIKNGKPK